MKRTTTYKPNIVVRTIGGVAVVCLSAFCLYGLTACTDDEATPATERPKLQIAPFTTPLTDISTPTRAVVDGVTVPDGFTKYSIVNPSPNIAYSTIGVFMTPFDDDRIQSVLYRGNDEWESNIFVDLPNKYYMYGFMPREMAAGASVSKVDGDYANGAQLFINDMQVLTPADPCVIVGVQDVTVTEGAGGTITLENGEVKRGVFTYDTTVGGSNKKKHQHYVRLLLDHLYAAVDLQLSVNATYAQLRRIRLRKMDFTTNRAESVDATVTIRANDTNSDPLSIELSDVKTGEITTTLFDNTIDDITEIPTDPAELKAKGFIPTATDYVQILGYFAPTVEDIERGLSITTTFDVYDMAGNLVRKNCKAVNKLPAIEDALNRGQKYMVKLTINPTYLYQLSNPDLNNPTIKVATP